MSPSNARIVSNVALTAVGVAAGYFVLKNPKLRRAAFRLLRIALTTTIPGYLVKEATDAWRETGRRAA